MMCMSQSTNRWPFFIARSFPGAARWEFDNCCPRGKCSPLLPARGPSCWYPCPPGLSSRHAGFHTSAPRLPRFEFSRSSAQRAPRAKVRWRGEIMTDAIKRVGARELKAQLHDRGEIALLDAREEGVFT